MENNSRKLEKIQERALRFVFSDFVSTYDELLLKANIPSLHIRRLKTMSIETFKILNEMAPPVLSNLVRLRDNSRYNFRYNNILQVPQVRTTKYGKNSFRYAAAVLWNSFPDEFRQVNNFSQFKSLLQTGMVGIVDVICVDNCAVGLPAAYLYLYVLCFFLCFSF